MNDGPQYSSASAFRAALEARLLRLAREEGTDLQRMRRQLAFDRLLARIFAQAGSGWALKGGYAMEVRLNEARTTKDLDLTLRDGAALPATGGALAERLRAALQAAAALDLSDHFEFLIAQPTLDIDAAPYGGARFPTESRIAGRTFVKFHLDVGVGDVVLEPAEVIVGRDWLAFAGIEPPQLRLVAREQQFAEKLHAYTVPDRQTPNSRVKDLVDLVLLIRRFPLDPRLLRAALEATFRRRATHELPGALMAPPPFWEKPFAALAAEVGLLLEVAEAFDELRVFYEKLGPRG